MTENMHTIMANLKERLGTGPNRLIPPYIYFDNGICLHFFQEFTGLNEPPPIRSADVNDEHISNRTPLISPDHLALPALHLLFDSMLPLVNERVPLIERLDQLTAHVHCFIRLQGLMQSTHFPDGRLNLEISFAGVRGVLFHTPEYFNSLIRPVIKQDRFFDFKSPVDMLAYLHGPPQKLIFYHQTYGDNKEYDWAPLVPVTVRNKQITEMDEK
jgi:hypothetical protein